MRPVLMLASAALAASLLPAHAGEKHIPRKGVPPAVLAAFQKAYPGAQALGYSLDDSEGRKVFEIESREGRVRRDLSYLPDGTLDEAEEVIAPSDLPKAVQQSIQASHPGVRILHAERDTRGAAVTYEVVISARGVKKEVVLDPEGKVIHG